MTTCSHGSKGAPFSVVVRSHGRQSLLPNISTRRAEPPGAAFPPLPPDRSRRLDFRVPYCRMWSAQVQQQDSRTNIRRQLFEKSLCLASMEFHPGRTPKSLGYTPKCADPIKLNVLCGQLTRCQLHRRMCVVPIVGKGTDKRLNTQGKMSARGAPSSSDTVNEDIKCHYGFLHITEDV